MTIDPGLLFSSGSIDIGTASPSSKNWMLPSYTKTNTISPLDFMSYVKSRKEYKTVTQADNMTNFNTIESDKVNILSVDNICDNCSETLTIDQNHADKISALVKNTGNVALIFQGDVKIDKDLVFKTASHSFVLMATGKIMIADAVQNLEGIYIGDSVDLSYDAITSTNPLKIKGNLIATGNVATNITKRNRASSAQPSVFVVFDPVMYANLLPYISTSIYEWTNRQ